LSLKINAYSEVELRREAMIPTPGLIANAVDLKGMFVDALASRLFGDSKIIGYQWSRRDRTLHCLVRMGNTNSISVYAMDVLSGEPIELRNPDGNDPQHFPFKIVLPLRPRGCIDETR
jgi:hypothetical protein